MNIIRKRATVSSDEAPEDKYVVWIDTSSTTPYIKIYRNGEWVKCGGEGSTPTPTEYDYYAYYGSSDTAISTESELKALNKSKYGSISGNCNKVYYYIAIYNSYTLTKVKTANNEDITSNFTSKGTITIDSNTYKYYELQSAVALDTTITITITNS